MMPIAMMIVIHTMRNKPRVGTNHEVIRTAKMSLLTLRGGCIYIVVGAAAPTQMSKNNDKS